MPTIYTSFAEAQNKALTDYSQAPNLRQYGGTVHHLDVTVTHVPATTNPLYLARLPKGARLLPQLCSVDFGDPTSGSPGDMIVKIGHLYDDGTGDDDAYVEALDLGTVAGRKTFAEAGTRGVAFLTPVPLAGDAWIVVRWTEDEDALSHAETWHLAYTLA